MEIELPTIQEAALQLIRTNEISYLPPLINFICPIPSFVSISDTLSRGLFYFTIPALIFNLLKNF